MPRTVKPVRHMTPEVEHVDVVKIRFHRGDGIDMEAPLTEVTAWYEDGRLIAEHDPAETDLRERLKHEMRLAMAGAGIVPPVHVDPDLEQCADPPPGVFSAYGRGHAWSVGTERGELRDVLCTRCRLRFVVKPDGYTTTRDVPG